MTTADIWANILAGIALLVSVVALYRSTRENTEANRLRKDHNKLADDQNKLANEQHKLAQGIAELGLRNSVIEARKQVSDFYAENHDFLAKVKADPNPSEDDLARRKRLKKMGDEHVEGYINALDAACQFYIDGKIDKVRFKKAYQAEIRDAVREPSHEEYFRTGHRFHALMKLFEEWENPEKD